MTLPVIMLADILADELPDLGNKRAALLLLDSAGYRIDLVAPQIDLIISLARDLRAEEADELAAHHE